MTIGDVGLYLGLISGLAGALGTFMGGFLGDRLGIVDKRWYVWVPLWGTLNRAATLCLYSLGPKRRSNSADTDPHYGPQHPVPRPEYRNVSRYCFSEHARSGISRNVFHIEYGRTGLGPLMVGVLSDLYVPIFGNDHLRYAMLTALVLGLLACSASGKGSRRLLDDIDAQARDSMDERAAQSAARSEA